MVGCCIYPPRRQAETLEDVRFLLRFGQVVNEHAGHLGDTLGPGGFHSAVSGNHAETPPAAFWLMKPSQAVTGVSCRKTYKRKKAGVIYVA